jgi:hypothetical protein
MSLLPTHHDEFRSKDYWDRFFLERGGEQFEWYGTYKEIEVRLLGLERLYDNYRLTDHTWRIDYLLNQKLLNRF